MSKPRKNFFGKKKPQSNGSSKREIEHNNYIEDDQSKSLKRKSSGNAMLDSLKRFKVDKTANSHDGGNDDSSISNGNIQDTESNLSDGTLSLSKGFVVPRGIKLTPLEQQVVELKRNYPDTILFIECGYKYRFFGEDSLIASQVLNIIAHPDHNFSTASIPVHRLHVHVRRLVAKGYKVGVVKQTESAALKAIGNNKNAPFTRELSAIYTASTLIGEDVTSMGDNDISESSITSSLLVLMESPNSDRKKTDISIIAIQPSTGEILYDYFEDTEERLYLHSRLEHIQPIEVIMMEDVSDLTKSTIQALTYRNEDCIRIERLSRDIFDYSLCLQNICQCFTGQEDKIMKVTSLPKDVVSCLGATFHYLKEFKLERIMKMAGNIEQFSLESSHMRLSGMTLHNLEVLTNSVDKGIQGSLFWVLNRTTTKFGARILRKWLLQPLLCKDLIEERLSLVTEMMSESEIIKVLKTAMDNVPDLEKSITTIFHKKCSTLEFWITLTSMAKVQKIISDYVTEEQFQVNVASPLVTLLKSVADALHDVWELVNNINETGAREGKKTDLFEQWTDFPDVQERRQTIKTIEDQLNSYKSDISRVLGLMSFQYFTVSGLEYLVEVKNNQLKNVPSSWKKISSTKACCRFRTPEVEKSFVKLQQQRDLLKEDCHQAWLTMLGVFAEKYQRYREGIRCLGTLDALMSLGNVAKSNGYCRPNFITGDAIIKIEGGKHPIVSQTMAEDNQFIENDTCMKYDEERVMLITGPNMGGKSCYTKQVALIVLMAQIGSFVPAQSCTLSTFDGIYTRMGASDDLQNSKSTFMVEMSESADIMKHATKRSLVILDELGRGTSTHDGVAIAMASLEYFIKSIKCLTIFVTHYLPLTTFGLIYEGLVKNYHMSFVLNEEDSKDFDCITFLYQLTTGSAGQSYGLNVARLAQIPRPIIIKAKSKSKGLEEYMEGKKEKVKKFKSLFLN